MQWHWLAMVGSVVEALGLVYCNVLVLQWNSDARDVEDAAAANISATPAGDEAEKPEEGDKLFVGTQKLMYGHGKWAPFGLPWTGKPHITVADLANERDHLRKRAEDAEANVRTQAAYIRQLEAAAVSG